MQVNYILEIEDSIERNTFEEVIDEILEKISIEDDAIEYLKPLFLILEKYEDFDFGMPGSITHFMEQYYKNGYEEALLESLNRKPTMLTVWMLNRIINDDDNNSKREFYIETMKKISNNKNIKTEIRDLCEFLLK